VFRHGFEPRRTDLLPDHHGATATSVACKKLIRAVATRTGSLPRNQVSILLLIKTGVAVHGDRGLPGWAPEALRAVEKLWRDSGIGASRDQIAALSLGRFVAWNRLSGGSVSGWVF